MDCSILQRVAVCCNVLHCVAVYCIVLQCAVLCGYSELPILQSLEPTLARVLLSPVREERRTERENKEGGDKNDVKAERTSVRLSVPRCRKCVREGETEKVKERG